VAERLANGKVCIAFAYYLTKEQHFQTFVSMIMIFI